MDARRNMNGRHPGGKIAAGGIFLGLILTFTLLFPLGLAAAALVPAEIPAPLYRWHTFQGGAGNDAGLEMDLDPVGNIYIVGQSNQTWNGPEGQSPIHGYNADFDVFVLKLDNSGNYLWHTFYGSALMDQPYGLAVDAAGNAYVSITSYSSWLGDGDTEPLVPYHGERDGVALKLDKDGAYQWHAFYGSSGSNEYGYGIGLDSSADPFFMISSGASWLGPTGQSPLNPFGFSDQHAAVLKLGKNGAYQWHTFYPGWGEPSLTFDSDENIILIAQCAVYWTGPLGQAPINNPIGAFDMEIIKLSHAGVYQWHTYQGNSNTDWGWDTVTDDDANIYATGYSEAAWNGPAGQAPLHAFTAGEKDLVVFKLNSGGSYQWHTFYGSAAKDESYNIEIDSEENLLVSGLGAGAWTGPVGQQPLYPYIGLDDITVINLSKDGLYRWHAFFGSLTGNDAAISIVADAWDDLYMVGYSGLSWNVGMIEPLNEHKLGGSDIPVLRLGYNRIFLPVIRR